MGVYSILINRHNLLGVARQNVRYIVVVLILFLFGCRTSNRGYSRMAVERYDLEELRSSYLKNTTPLDTIMTLTLANGATMFGVENNLFVFKKKNEVTQIERISNFRKFETCTLSDSMFNWNNITTNIQLFINDSIREYIKTIEDNKTVFTVPDSDGNTQHLSIYFGNIKHSVFLGPSVDAFNKKNINLALINKLTEVVNGISWTPAEKLKTRMER